MAEAEEKQQELEPPKAPEMTPTRRKAIEKATRIENALRTAQATVGGHADDARWLRLALEGKDPEEKPDEESEEEEEET